MAAGDVSVSISKSNARGCSITSSAGDKLSLSSAIAVDDWRSIAFWVYPNKELGVQKIICTGSRVILFIGTSNTYQTAVTGAITNIGGVSTPVTWNTWTHFCITFNGSQYLFYKNGSLVGTAITTTNTSTIQYLMNNSGGTQTCLGGINNFKVYDVVLDAEEVSIMGAGGSVTRGLKYSFPLYPNLNAVVGSKTITGTGETYGSLDTNVEEIIRNSRVGATDKFLVNTLFGDTIMISAIAES